MAYMGICLVSNKLSGLSFIADSKSSESIMATTRCRVGALRGDANLFGHLKRFRKDFPPRRVCLIAIQILCNPDYPAAPYSILKYVFPKVVFHCRGSIHIHLSTAICNRQIWQISVCGKESQLLDWSHQPHYPVNLLTKKSDFFLSVFPQSIRRSHSSLKPQPVCFLISHY
jgi:hypothetical protein